MSKVFTGLLLADMVTRSEVELGTSLSDIFAVGGRLGRTTLLALATHSSGLARLARSPRLYWRAVTGHPDPYAGFSTEDWQRWGRLSFRRRGGGHYSNLGFDILAGALAEAVGTPYAELLNERVLGPLALTSTSFEDDARMVPPRNCLGLKVPPWSDLRSSAKDLARVVEGFLDPEATPMASAFRLATKEHYELDDQRGSGLGIFVIKSGRGMRHWSNGATDGSRCVLAFNVETKRGAVLLTDGTGRSIENYAARYTSTGG